ncbi:HlyD family type I secretion periplasmic adaptor subunit [Starkeya koreensis]|uniref:Membrane fusion protein (MFP) family protein n=1 Tax=Ancylobacter koreensis TaxID=266121 RepID=A0ABT0DHG1_9HYPH|nr:HlyD family type I secretion periplasmic adaptor subunit [Ancylobacter koreensis]MCK0206707.1 HlyD family type I secretion periplasmic adaptor subunit [Ancylobacter koreensis]
MNARADTPSSFAAPLRRLALAGGSAVLLFAGTVGVWAVSATLGGAVVAPGQFVVDGNVKKVQHATGGIVGQLNVREGDAVAAGDVLMRLDDTLTRANLQVIARQLDEFAARRGRLVAERDGSAVIAPAPEFASRRGESEVEGLLSTEENQFRARRAAREGRKAQLSARIGQLEDEMAGLRAQQAARDRQAVLIAEELEGVRDLYAKNLVVLSRKAALEREAAELDGEKGRLVAALAQAEGRVAETRLQIIGIDEGLREEAMKELAEIGAKAAELAERRVAAQDQLRRVDIRAPSAGHVHQLAVHTVGGVITPAEPVMLIVPAGEALEVEARVLPPDIDQIVLGHAAEVRIHAFNQRTTPQLAGTVTRVSADTSRDPQTGAVFYTIRVALPAAELARLAPQQVSAGMQAEVFVRTLDRTPFEYLVKPLRDQVARAFRER